MLTTNLYVMLMRFPPNYRISAMVQISLRLLMLVMFLCMFSSIYLTARCNMLLHAVNWINPLDLIYNPYTEDHRNDSSLQSWYPHCKFERYENYQKKSIVLCRVFENGYDS